LAVFQARYAEAIEEGLISPGLGDIENVGGGVEFLATMTDFGTGPLKHTGGRTDLAIKGEGFFVVQKGEQRMLTRAGNFLISPTGRLETQQGYPVLNDSGVPIVINPQNPQWQFTDSGELRQGANVQEVAVVKPVSYDDLVRSGENLFRPLAEPEPLPRPERRLAVGYVEGSGVSATTEMTTMIEASRMFQANMQLMKTQDQMIGGLVNRVLKV